MSDLGHGNGQYLTAREALGITCGGCANLDKRGSITLSTKFKVAKDKRRRHRERMINPQR